MARRTSTERPNEIRLSLARFGHPSLEGILELHWDERFAKPVVDCFNLLIILKDQGKPVAWASGISTIQEGGKFFRTRYADRCRYRILRPLYELIGWCRAKAGINDLRTGHHSTNKGVTYSFTFYFKNYDPDMVGAIESNLSADPRGEATMAAAAALVRKVAEGFAEQRGVRFAWTVTRSE